MAVEFKYTSPTTTRVDYQSSKTLEHPDLDPGDVLIFHVLNAQNVSVPPTIEDAELISTYNPIGSSGYRVDILKRKISNFTPAGEIIVSLNPGGVYQQAWVTIYTGVDYSAITSGGGVWANSTSLITTPSVNTVGYWMFTAFRLSAATTSNTYTLMSPLAGEFELETDGTNGYMLLDGTVTTSGAGVQFNVLGGASNNWPLADIVYLPSKAEGEFETTYSFNPNATTSSTKEGTFQSSYSFGPLASTGARESAGTYGASYRFNPVFTGFSPEVPTFESSYSFGPITATGRATKQGTFVTAFSFIPEMKATKFVLLRTLSNQTAIITPRHTGQVLRLANEDFLTVAETPIKVYGSGDLKVSVGWWDEFAIVNGNFKGSYFDGSSTYDTDLLSEWAGVTNDSKGILMGAPVVGVPTVGYQSSKWASDRTKSWFVPELEDVDPAREDYIEAWHEIHDNFTELSNETFLITARDVGQTVYLDDVAHTSTKSNEQIRVHGSGYIGLSPGWWDGLNIVDGNYIGPYFDGQTRAKYRRNLAIDPACANPSPTIYTNSTGASTVERVTDNIKDSPYGYKLTKVNNTGYAFIRGNSPSPASATSGVVSVQSEEEITISFWAFTNTDVIINIPTRSAFGYTGYTLNLTSGYTYVSRTVKANNRTSVGLDIGWEAGHNTPGDSVTISGLKMSIGEPFPEEVWMSGDYSPDPTKAAAWEGTPNASPSYLYDEDLDVRWAANPDDSPSIMDGDKIFGVETHNAVAIRTKRWKKRGLSSLRLISKGDEAYAMIPIPALSKVTGVVMASVHLEKPLEGPLAPEAISLGVSNPDSRVPAPNQAGTYNLRMNFPADNTEVNYMILNHGGEENSGDLFWDELGIFDGYYIGNYFDGDMHSTPSNIYEWDGTPHMSTTSWRSWDIVPDDVFNN